MEASTAEVAYEEGKEDVKMTEGQVATPEIIEEALDPTYNEPTRYEQVDELFGHIYGIERTLLID